MNRITAAVVGNAFLLCLIAPSLFLSMLGRAGEPPSAPVREERKIGNERFSLKEQEMDLLKFCVEDIFYNQKIKYFDKSPIYFKVFGYEYAAMKMNCYEATDYAHNLHGCLIDSIKPRLPDFYFDKTSAHALYEVLNTDDVKDWANERQGGNYHFQERTDKLSRISPEGTCDFWVLAKVFNSRFVRLDVFDAPPTCTLQSVNFEKSNQPIKRTIFWYGLDEKTGRIAQIKNLMGTLDQKVFE